MKERRKRFVLMAVLGVLAFCGPVLAAVLNVTSQSGGIQAAIDAAVSGDYVIVSPGTYRENINFQGKNIVVTSTDPGDLAIVSGTIIDANGSGSVVTFENGETSQAKLTGFTITGGYGTFNNSLGQEIYWGGGIYCNGASPTIANNVITGNNGPVEIVGDEIVEVGYGGAIGCINSSPIITRNVIRDNSAFAAAGIITFFENPIITNNLIYDNSAYIAGGAAILYGGQFSNNTLVANSAPTAGNLYVASNSEIDQVVVLNNIICNAQEGGGVYTEGSNIIQYNNVWNNAGGNYINSSAPTGSEGNISSDPLFVEPGANDYHLQPDSPCINAGDPDFVPEPDERDIDNEFRVFSFQVDMGADEYYGNIRPIADAGPDQLMNLLPLLVNLDGSGSWDPDGDALDYRWNQIEGPVIELSNANIDQPTFKPLEFGIYAFELIVNDGLLDSIPDTVGIVVGNNHAPVANAGTVRYAGSEITLDGTGTYDPDGYGALSYQWIQLSGPTAVITNADTAEPTIYFTQTNEVQYCEFELVVNDGGLESTDTTIVIVVPSFGTNALYQTNPPFDPDKPTIVAFGGGNCNTGGSMSFGGLWTEKANWITASYSPPYHRYGDMLIVYLSGVAPDYEQLIQTIGFSTGNMPAIDVAGHVNLSYADPRYAVNRVSLLDAACRGYGTSIAQFRNSTVDGEQCWIDNYYATHGQRYSGARILNVRFPAPPADHGTPVNWYMQSAYAYSWPEDDIYNNGITAGYYYSVIGPGKNLRLSDLPNAYHFKWVDSNPDYLELNQESSYPSRLPEAITLAGPADGDTLGVEGAVFSCEQSENSVGYQLLFGADPYRVMDYNVISDTVSPPSEIITELPLEETWWTVRTRDLYGSTIHADPRLIRAPRNIEPVSDAGQDQSVVIGEDVYLDGSGSSDADGDLLSFGWEFVSRPADSVAEINSPTSEQVSFVPDIPGEYVVSLVVNDGDMDSEVDEVTITAISLEQAAMQALTDSMEGLDGLDPNNFKNGNMKKALMNKMNALQGMIGRGGFEGALQKLENDIFPKMDGCAESGEPDKNDWIITCDGQDQVCPYVSNCIEYLKSLME